MLIMPVSWNSNIKEDDENQDMDRSEKTKITTKMFRPASQTKLTVFNTIYVDSTDMWM